MLSNYIRADFENAQQPPASSICKCNIWSPISSPSWESLGVLRSGCKDIFEVWSIFLLKTSYVGLQSQHLHIVEYVECPCLSSLSCKVLEKKKTLCEF